MSQVLLVQPRTEDWQSGRVLHLSIRSIDTTDLFYHYTTVRLIVVITLEAAMVFFQNDDNSANWDISPHLGFPSHRAILVPGGLQLYSPGNFHSLFGG